VKKAGLDVRLVTLVFKAAGSVMELVIALMDQMSKLKDVVPVLEGHSSVALVNV
jgi:hypothetical protein